MHYLTFICLFNAIEWDQSIFVTHYNSFVYKKNIHLLVKISRHKKIVVLRLHWQPVLSTIVTTTAVVNQICGKMNVDDKGNCIETEERQEEDADDQEECSSDSELDPSRLGTKE